MESIESFVAEQLAAWKVPGCAVAAVRDGNVVLAAGWGLRDLETGLPGTLFARRDDLFVDLSGGDRA